MRGYQQLIDAHLGQPDVVDLALALELDEGAELVLEGHERIHFVELVEVDRPDAEAAQAHLAALAQVIRPRQVAPLVRAGAEAAALRGNEDVAVGKQRPADQVLGDEGPVGIGRVDEVHAEFGGSTQEADGSRYVGGRSPDPRTGQLGRSVAEPGNR